MGTPPLPVETARPFALLFCFAVVVRIFALFQISAHPTPPDPANSASSSTATDRPAFTSKPFLPSAASTHPRLHRIPAEISGIHRPHHFPTNAPIELLQDQGVGSAVCLADFDGDGLPEIFTTHFDQGNRLYRNRGGFQFEDITARAGVEAKGAWCAGATAIDIDSDGDLDLQVCVFNGPNLLFINQGNATFENRAADWGLDFSGASVSMTFADYDRDGFLDAYLVTHRLSVGPDHRLPRNTQESLARSILQWGRDGQPRIHPRYEELFTLMPKGNGRVDLAIAGQRDRLFRNTGHSRFSEVSDAAGIVGNDIGLAAAWWDFNSDGWPDLYVSNDYKGPDRLYKNLGNGRFQDVAPSVLPHTPWSSMGVDVGDLNNDGWPDLLATDMAGVTHYRRMTQFDDIERERWFFESSLPKQRPKNALFLGSGTDRVWEAAHLTHLAYTDWTWSPLFADFDQNGSLDLFIATGMSRDYVNADLLAQNARGRSSPAWKSQPLLREQNFVFQNRGNLNFENVTGRWLDDSPGVNLGAAVADLDGDGDLDLVCTDLESPLRLYRNDVAQGASIRVRLIGPPGNSFALGATLRAEFPQGLQSYTVSATHGFMSSSEPIAHFGLGSSQQLPRLHITWPNGLSQTVSNLAAHATHVIAYPRPTSSQPDPPRDTVADATPRPWFAPPQSFAPGPALHPKSAPQDDLLRTEPWLPWDPRPAGCVFTSGNLNADSLPDVVVGACLGAPPTVWLQTTPGSFTLSQQSTLALDPPTHDRAIALLDWDGDGDLDLIRSGAPVGSTASPRPLEAPIPSLQVFLNDGRGTFLPSDPRSIPTLESLTGVLVSADFDRDGQTDLFVGAGVDPRQYPKGGTSRIFSKKQNQWIDATSSIAPRLDREGFLSDAVSADFNKDGWPDLALAFEWGPISIFLNHQGVLRESNLESHLRQNYGLWSRLACGDLDNDGDVDLVAGNLGLNTRYSASPARPALLFGGSLEESPAWRIIEGAWDGDRIVPTRTLPALRHLFPQFAARFPTHAAYAQASLESVVGSDSWKKLQRFEVRLLESGALLNQGDGRFSWKPLPTLAQISPVIGLALLDVNADGVLDLCLSQNKTATAPDVGPFDGGFGLVLKGMGRGEFSPVPPRESGFFQHHDGHPIAPFALQTHGPSGILEIDHAGLPLFTPLTQQTQPKSPRQSAP